MERKRMAINEVLTRVDGPEWSRGFNNLVKSDIPSWFRTMKWWAQFLWVFFMTNVIISFTFIGGEFEEVFSDFNLDSDSNISNFSKNMYLNHVKRIIHYF